MTRSRKLPNLFYTGQYPHPGVGVPMTLIASRIAVDAALGTGYCGAGRSAERERNRAARPASEGGEGARA